MCQLAIITSVVSIYLCLVSFCSVIKVKVYYFLTMLIIQYFHQIYIPPYNYNLNIQCKNTVKIASSYLFSDIYICKSE